MKSKTLLLLSGVALALTGCIDNNFDLADVDTTSEFKVKDLVLPINLAPVTLSDIIHVEEGEKLKEVTINGTTFYAIQQTGEIKSDPIKIGTFVAKPSHLNSTQMIFSRLGQQKSRAASQYESAELESQVNEPVEYNASNIDEAIKGLTKILTEPATIKISISNPKRIEENAYFKSLSLKFPKGLMVSNIAVGGESEDPDIYDPKDGSMELEDVNFKDNQLDIELTVDGVDLSGYDDLLVYDEDEGSFKLESSLEIEDALLSFQDDELEGDFTFNVDFELSDLEVKSMEGDISYDFDGEGLEIDPIGLTDIPNFLDNAQTDIKLANPQIYLKLNNPIGQYGLKYQSGLEIISKRDTGYEPFPSPVIEVKAKEGNSNYVLAPSEVDDIPEQFESDIEYLQYDNLGNLLSGEGLPEELIVKLVNPRIPEQSLTSPFELGQDIPGMEGEYMFLAPLALAEGSTIVKSVDGWWSEDLADLYIENLTVTTNVTNGLSTGVILHVYAIDRDGKPVSTEGKVVLEENAVNSPIEIELKGIDGKPFNNLDGINLYVIAGENQGEPLAPDQTITLDEIRGKVTGSYIRKL